MATGTTVSLATYRQRWHGILHPASMSDLNANEWDLHELASYRIAVGSKKARIQILFISVLYLLNLMCSSNAA